MWISFKNFFYLCCIINMVLDVYKFIRLKIHKKKNFDSWEIKKNSDKIYTLGDFIMCDYPNITTSFMLRVIIALLVQRLIVVIQIILGLDFLLFNTVMLYFGNHYEIKISKNLIISIFIVLPYATSFLVAYKMLVVRKLSFYEFRKVVVSIIFLYSFFFSRWGYMNSITMVNFFDKMKTSPTHFGRYEKIKYMVDNYFSDNIEIYLKIMKKN